MCVVSRYSQACYRHRASCTDFVTSNKMCNSFIMFLKMNILLTYLLTPWCRFFLEKLTGLQLVKKYPAFHGTRRFITALTSVRHMSLSWASPIQSIYPHPTSWWSSLILSTRLRLGLPSGLLPSGFPSKTLYTPSSKINVLGWNKSQAIARHISETYKLYVNFTSFRKVIGWRNFDFRKGQNL